MKMKKTLNDIPPFDPAHDNEDKPDLYQHFEDEIDYDPDQGFDDDEEDDFDSRGDAYGEDDEEEDDDCGSDAYGEDDDEDEDNMENLEADDCQEGEDDYGGDDSEGEDEDVDNEDVKAPERSSFWPPLVPSRMLGGRPVTSEPEPTPPPSITFEQIRNAKPMPDFRPGTHRF